MSEQRCEHCTHYSHGECWAAAMKMVHAADLERVDAIVELERAIALLEKHQWVEPDEGRDRCIECGGTKPDRDDAMPMGHVKGCALAIALRTAGVTVMVSGVLA